MTDLTQLKSVTTALPCEFAANAGLSTKDFPVTADGDLCLADGFPSGYSVTTSSRKDIQRDDMNRLGMLASRELHYKQAGGVHTFVANEQSTGFSEKALLSYWDEVFLKFVESQYASNDIDFTENPDAIDGLYQKPDDTQKKIWWKTSGYIYGIANSLLSAGGNFSNAKSSTGSTTTLTVNQDSLVSLGDYIYGLYAEVKDVFDTVEVGDQLRNMVATVTITPPNAKSVTVSFPCKGRNGVYAVSKGMLFWYQTFPAELCGNSNFDLCFFAKAGTQISCTLSANEMTPTTKTVSSGRYYPLVVSVKESTDEEQ